MTTCPSLDDLLAGAATEHAVGCAGCRAVIELTQAAGPPPAIDCVEAEMFLAARAVRGLEHDRARRLDAHLDSCEPCRAVSRDLVAPGVVDALAGSAEEEQDFTELGVISPANYVRGREIGRGGMGRVVRARDRRLGRAVAIKELIDEKLRARFENEARLTARLQHPAIVSVHEAGRWPSGEAFYAMKYVAGRPLDQVIAGKRSLADRLALLPNVLTVVEAMAYAHAERVIHRDLKPHNILIGPFGETVIIDWGLAKDLGATTEPSSPYRDGEAVLTAAGSGTPGYMPPEQVRGESADERVDVFALGATLYHLLSGRRPGGGDFALPADVPRELAAIVAKATATDPAARYPSAAELASELRRFQSGQLVAAHHYSAAELMRRWARRHGAVLVAAALGLLALAGVGAVSVTRVVNARARAEAAAAEARIALADSLVERARQELQSGAPARALVFIHEALRRGADGRQVRFLLGEAARSTAALETSIDARDATIMALSPDGTQLALAGPNGAEVYALPSGRLVRELEAGPITALAYDGGGTLLAVGGAAQVTLYEAATLAVTARLPHAAPVAGVRFRGRALVTWAGAQAAAWAVDGTLRARFDHPAAVVAAELDPSGQLVVTAAVDGSARLWSAAGALKWTVAGSTVALEDASFSPDGAKVVTAGPDNHGRVLDTTTGKVVATVELSRGERVRRAEPSADGLSILLHGNWSAKLWSERSVVELATGVGPIQARLSPDGARVATLAADGVLRVWDEGGRQSLLLEGHTGPGRALAWSADSRRLVSLGSDGTARSWNAAAGRVTALLPMAQGAARFDDRGRLYTLSNGGAQMWDAASGRLLAAAVDFETAARHTEARGSWMAIRPDGTLLFVDFDGQLRRWDPASGAIGPVAGQDHPVLGALAPGGRYALHRGRDGVEVVDVASGARLARLGVRSLFQPGFSGDGRRVFAVVDGAVRGWDLQTGALVLDARPCDKLQYVAVPDSANVVFVYSELDRDAHLVDVATGREVTLFRGHTDAITGAASDANATRLLTISLDGTARLWDVASGQTLMTLPIPRDVELAPTHGVALSPDGAWAAVEVIGGTLVLDLSSDPRPIAEVERQLEERVPFRFDRSRLVPRAAARSIPGPAAAPAGPAVTCPTGLTAHGAGFPADLASWCTDRRGRPHGTMTIWRPTGVPLMTVEWDHGRLEGRTTMWDENGRLAVVADHVAAAAELASEVRSTRFYPSGKVAEKLEIHRWRGMTSYVSYYESGAVRDRIAPAPCEGRECDFMRPQSGVWTTLRENGTKEREGRYLSLRAWPGAEASRVGTWTMWDEDGKERTEVHPCPQSPVGITYECR
jgi:eukaryotic-like serine/threonine-protein kinase